MEEENIAVVSEHELDLDNVLRTNSSQVLRITVLMTNS